MTPARSTRKKPKRKPLILLGVKDLLYKPRPVIVYASASPDNVRNECRELNRYYPSEARRYKIVKFVEEQ